MMERGINLDNYNAILESIANPHELERLFRQDPNTFKSSFNSIWEQNNDSQILAVWHERLNFSENENTEIENPVTANILQKDYLTMGILAVLSGLSTRIIFHFALRQVIAPINLVFGILFFMAAYFIFNHSLRKNISFVVVSLFLISAVYINMLPLKENDAIILAYLHLPVFLWVVIGLAYTGNDYKLGSNRLAYLKFNGEFLILYAIMAISGMLLTLLTMQLFSFVGMDISEFYFKNVVLFGAAALAIVATYLVSKNLKLAKNIAPFIAKIFSPLVLATLLVYLITVIWVGKNPFSDRNFLMSFNGILLCVLAVTVFSITENSTDNNKNISDYVNFALIVLALVIDSIALSAILFRLTSYGITPNRIAVLGVNIVICVHLIRIMIAYIQFLRNKNGTAIIKDTITTYLPIYGLWAAIVTFSFPLIFNMLR
jgi:hypothetical protein